MYFLLTALLLAAPADKKGARDQRLYRLIERETQISSLLSAGKLAYDAGDLTAAAAKWEALLRIDGLPEDVQQAVKPLLAEAKAGRGSAGRADAEAEAEPEEKSPAAKPRAPPKPANVTLTGTVSGGGAIGPAGAVITLHRADGWTPRAQPMTRLLQQKDKRFVPHVAAITVGSSVNFRNEDDLFHNVFSLSPAAKFDTGLHKAGVETPVKFDKPGVVELLCNIHASMLGYLVVVDTPWFAVTDGSGGFQINNVPPGEYEASVWHENAAAPQQKKITVAEGAQLSFNISADKRANPFPPDKYGKPRQQQLGY